MLQYCEKDEDDNNNNNNLLNAGRIPERRKSCVSEV